jgi:two-component system CheB/CheR fusion protein
MLKVLLKKEGHEAEVAFDGPAALAAADRHQPDVVFLDLSSPGMSGIEVAAALRCDPGRSGPILVAISGHGADSMPAPSPFDRYFVKPVDMASLLAYLAEVQRRQEAPAFTTAVA